MLPTLLLLATLQDPLAVRADSVRPRHDALSYAIDLTLPASGHRITASVRTRWRLAGPEPIRIDLDTVFIVRRALVNGQPVAPERAGLPFLLAHGGAAGDTVETWLDYEGTPADGLVIRDGPSGRTIFADNWPDRARRWLASQDHPADQAPVSWRIDAPAGLTVVATGALQGMERAGDRGVLSRDSADLMREMSGQDLDWYFRQALTQPGYPVLEVTTTHRGDSLAVTLRQVQPGPWGLFRIPSLEVQVDRTIFTVPLTGAEATVVVPKEDAGPAEVRVDPNGWWLMDVKQAGAR